MLVLDEADEMLNRGFKEQVYDIYRYLPPSTQVILVSATMPHEVLEMTHKFMNNPFRVLVKRDELTLEGIKQFFGAVEVRHLVRCVRHAAHYPGGHLLQHEAKSRLVDPEDEGRELYRRVHPRRHAAEG